MELHALFFVIHLKKFRILVQFYELDLVLSMTKRRTFFSFKMTVYFDFFKPLSVYEVVVHNDDFEFCYVIFVHYIQNIEATFRLSPELFHELKIF